MKLLSEQKFKMVECLIGDSFEVTFTSKDRGTVATTSLPGTYRKFNVMRVYEADSFDGLTGALIVVLGWINE